MLNGDEAVGLHWQTILAFIRIATNARAVKTPVSIEQACLIVDSWLQRRQVVVVEAGERFWPLLREQLIQARVNGPLVTDAALAAFALEQGATSGSADREFVRLPTLKRLDPARTR